MHKSLALLMSVQVNHDMNFLSGLETGHSKSELHDRSWRGVLQPGWFLLQLFSPKLSKVKYEAKLMKISAICSFLVVLPFYHFPYYTLFAPLLSHIFFKDLLAITAVPKKKIEDNPYTKL